MISGATSNPDFRDGLRVQQLLDVAMKSHKNGGQVMSVLEKIR